MRENGILQPILVRPHDKLGGHFEIVAGERRWRAAQLAQLHEVPIILRSLDDRSTLEIALIENVQREDLTPLEEAEGYARLMSEFDYTQETLAERIGKSRSAIANLLRLRGLPEAVRALISEGKLSVGHARTLIGAPDPIALAHEIVAKDLERPPGRSPGKEAEARSFAQEKARPRRPRPRTPTPARSSTTSR